VTEIRWNRFGFRPGKTVRMQKGVWYPIEVRWRQDWDPGTPGYFSVRWTKIANESPEKIPGCAMRSE
jgi:hypothetical protein